MRNLLISLVLGSIAPFAAAQCVSDTHPLVAQFRSGGELIKTAGAATDTPVRRQGPPAPAVARPGQAHATNSDEEHRSGSRPVMLLTALAVMSAIALRRAGASDR